MKNKSLIRKYSKKSIEKIISKNSSIAGVIRDLGYTAVNGSLYDAFKKYCEEIGVDLSVLEGVPNTVTKRNRENVFCENSTANQTTLRRFFEKEDISYICSICGQKPFWNGQNLSLTLDHINGDNHDNRLENLRWVCPNCDRQLPTFGVRNKKNQDHKKIINFCARCGEKITRNNRSGFCKECYLIEIKDETSDIYKKFNPRAKAKVDAVYENGQLIEMVDSLGTRYDKEAIEELIKKTASISKVAEFFNLSDNGFRKYLIKFGLSPCIGFYIKNVTPSHLKDEEIIMSLKKTKSFSASAKELGVNASSLQDYCSKHIKNYKSLINKNISKKELIEELSKANGSITKTASNTGRCRQYIKKMIAAYNLKTKDYKK